MSTVSKITAAIALVVVIAAPMNVEAKISKRAKNILIGCVIGATTVATVGGVAYYYQDNLAACYNDVAQSLGDKKETITNWVNSFFVDADDLKIEISEQLRSDTDFEGEEVVVADDQKEVTTDANEQEVVVSEQEEVTTDANEQEVIVSEQEEVTIDANEQEVIVSEQEEVTIDANEQEVVVSEQEDIANFTTDEVENTEIAS